MLWILPGIVCLVLLIRLLARSTQGSTLQLSLGDLLVTAALVLVIGCIAGIPIAIAHMIGKYRDRKSNSGRERIRKRMKLASRGRIQGRERGEPEG